MHDMTITFGPGGARLKFWQLTDAALTELEQMVLNNEFTEEEPGARDNFLRRIEIERIIRAKGLSSE